jgi:hypothetical protein
MSNHHNHGGVFDTWTKCTRAQAEWTQGPASRLGFEALWPEPWLPHVYTRRRSPSQWRKSVEATPPSRLATWLGRSATTWRQTNLSKSVEVSFTPIHTPLRVIVDTPHSTCSSPLVKVPISSSCADEALSGVESQVESSLDLQK